MEPISALGISHILARQLFFSVCFILFRYQSVEDIISEVFEEFNFLRESGLLQFWKCIGYLDSEDIGCNLVLLDKPFRLTDQNHEELKNYRRKSHDNVIRFVGAQKKVTGNWFAGRAAQTGIADHRTKDLVHSHHYQQYAEAAGMGQCVLPVFYVVGDRKKLAGVIELVTSVPKESYVEDFNQLVHLLGGRGLESSYMGKTIKVQYDDMIKFNLPISAKFTDLLKEVTNRFQELKYKHVCIKYKSNHRISNDEDLQKCMKESNSKGEAFIRMFIEHVGGTCDCTSGEII
uniref:uncharacterized protein LOC122609946 n=1 Tax=Erigeron canadensis TaxID=72917 RepID=UPI001CB8C8F0|nr:uncharacterized protein LOC122609946 [Erigeron canadensis]